MRALPADRGLRVVVSCDGASRGNPGPAGIGVVIAAPAGEVLAEIARGIGVQTNNFAEYTAVIQGLARAGELGATDVLVRSDSRLLVEQLSGRFRVKNATLRRLHEEVRRETARFRRIRYEHVPRERNRHADLLANRGLDEWLAAGGATATERARQQPLWEPPPDPDRD